MYAAVANRTTEIGTLRALGFEKGSILVAFILESLFLGLIGGAAGLFSASFMQLITILHHELATFFRTGLQFFHDNGDNLEIPGLFPYHGVCRGLMPAFRAARMNIVDALRST